MAESEKENSGGKIEKEGIKWTKKETRTKKEQKKNLL